MLVDTAYELLLREIVGDALLQLHLVARVVEQHSIGTLAVASGTSGFLEVGFDGVGTVVVDDQTHIGLVDAHAKGVGSHYHPPFVVLPLLLVAVLDGGVESGMEVVGTDAGVGEHLGYLLGALAAAHIDDGTALHGSEDMQQLVVFVGGVAHDVAQVLALKAHAEHVVFFEPQLVLDVYHHLGRGGGSEREDRYIGLDAAYVGNTQVTGTEVIAPLADAMGFVDGDKTNVDVL